jgi:hypothetical protein
MFEEYIEKNIKGILGNFNLDNDKIYIEEIVSNAGIADFYKSFALAELDWWMLIEEESRSSNQNFDYNSSNMKSNLIEFDLSLKQNAFFTKDDFTDFISFAVKSRINFLCRPQFTITNFCFSSSYELSIKVLLKKLAYFSDYSYFQNSFATKIEELNYNNETILSKEDFVNMIEEIDYENILNLSSKEFVELVNPIYSFFNILDNENQNQLVPSESLLIFFDDKSINPIVSALQRKYTNPEFKFINREVLHQFIIQMIEATEAGEMEDESESAFDLNLDDTESSDYDSVSDVDSFEVTIESVNEDFDSILDSIESNIEESNNVPNSFIDNGDNVIIKEFEVFDLLDAEDELADYSEIEDVEPNEKNAFVDIDKFTISEDDQITDLDFNEFETLLESKKELKEEIESETILDNELLSEFNLILNDIDSKEVIDLSNNEMIKVLEKENVDLTSEESSLIEEVLLDEIEEKLDVKIEDEIEKVKMNIIDEVTLVLKNMNNEKSAEDIDEIGSLLDDISKINDV